MLPIEKIYICNTFDDCINKLDIENFKLDTLHLNLFEKKPVGPIAIDISGGDALVVNKFEGTIAYINLEKFTETTREYICPSPKDIKLYGNYAYVVSDEVNCITIYNILKKTIDLQIKVGNCPESITIDKVKDVLFCANLLDDTVSAINLADNTIINNISVGKYPIKVKMSNDNSMLYVCESNVEKKSGFISIYSNKNLELQKRIEVGKTPVDFVEDNGILYVTNFEDGSVSIINIRAGLEEKRITLDGMLNRIVKIKEKIYITDYINGNLYEFDTINNKIKIIAIGKEPNAMILN